MAAETSSTSSRTWAEWPTHRRARGGAVQGRFAKRPCEPCRERTAMDLFLFEELIPQWKSLHHL